MKQEPTEVILQDEYLEERRRNPRSIMGRWPMVFRVAKEGRGGCQIGPFFSGDAPVEGKGRPIVRWVP